jgi:Recombination endonuclease VII
MAAELAELLPLEEFGMQICRGPCGRKLPLAEFPTRPEMRLGVLKKCKECHSAYSRGWVEKNPDKAFNSHLLRRFGITLDEYNAMLARQGGVCAICGEPPTSPRNRRKGAQRTFKARLVVDHDHATGKVRGLLCGTCNTGIGSLKDDAATVRAALDYLERK